MGQDQDYTLASHYDDTVSATDIRVSFEFLRWHQKAWLELQEHVDGARTEVEKLSLRQPRFVRTAGSPGVEAFQLTRPIVDAVSSIVEVVDSVLRTASTTFGAGADRFHDSLARYLLDTDGDARLLRVTQNMHMD